MRNNCLTFDKGSDLLIHISPSFLLSVGTRPGLEIKVFNISDGLSAWNNGREFLVEIFLLGGGGGCVMCTQPPYFLDSWFPLYGTVPCVLNLVSD